MNVLVIDVGGTHVKLLASGATEPRKFNSGDGLTPEQLVAGIRETAEGWQYDAVSLGLPTPVLRGAVMEEPWNLGRGWVGFDFAAAVGVPVRIINDAAMQALGSYHGGRMLYLGLGTGLGSALVIDGVVQPLELAHLPYRKGRTFEDYVGQRGYERLGKRAWVRHVTHVVEALRHALQVEYVVLGGGGVKRLERLPPGCRAGTNANAFTGGVRLWEAPHASRRRAAAAPRGRSKRVV